MDAIDDERERELILLVTIPSLLLICLLPLFGFAKLAVAVMFIVFIGVIPLMTVYIDTHRDESDIEDDAANPVEELRERYIEGELSEAEFEQAVERELADDSSLDVGSDRKKFSDRELEPES